MATNVKAGELYSYIDNQLYREVYNIEEVLLSLSYRR